MSVADATRASEFESRFRTIFACAPECVKLVGPDGALIDMNPAGLRMIDAPSLESVRGRNILELIDPAYHEAFNEAMAAVLRGEKTQTYFEVIGLSGQRLFMDQSASPLFDRDDPTRVVEMVAITRDITAQRNAEAELMRARISEEINRSRSEFLANISHQLKTPLNHVIGYSELLQEAAQEQGRSNDAADLQRVLDAASALLSMINQMLSVSLIDAKQSAVCADLCDVSELVDDVVEAMQPAAAANANRIVIEPCAESGLWTCDAAKINQCLRCLVSNAAKFTRNGVITIRTSRSSAGGHTWMLLEVSDTGVGIEPEKLGAIFSPFSGAREDGLGLGLTLTSQLARLMGGDINVESVPGKGSHFTLRIPAQFHPDSASQRIPAA